MSKKSQTPLLDTINSPKELRRLSEKELVQLAGELREDMVQMVSKTGGHLGAGLGVVELSIALHYVFDTPKDRLVWDVGHQSYPHKILTKRRGKMGTLRQKGGLSGFTKRAESVYDAFGAAHSSTSISAGLGMAMARDILGKDNHIICVIGDGAMSAGMAYEAMNNAGAMDKRLIVILNDNDMSIAPPVGAMSAYLARLLSGSRYRKVRNIAKNIVHRLPARFAEKVRRMEEYMRGFAMGGTLFEEMGFYYVGPIDGHNMAHLLPILRNVKKAKTGPILLHVVTKKGYGYEPAEKAADKYHGVGSFNPDTGEKHSAKAAPPSYTSIFARQLIAEAKRDKKIVAFTAAMPEGTGLDRFAKQFPERCFDVGIAEQHAVTCAAGMACEGFKPFVAIYSTFLQRAYDQIVHDVAIQKLPLRFAIDRAGLVGADGPTHAGAFDLAYLACLPHFTLMAASDEIELMRMVKTAALIDDAPSAFRYPRGAVRGLEIPKKIEPLEIGKGRVIAEGERVAFLNLGARLAEVEKAAEILRKKNIAASIIDMRFMKPLDSDLLLKLAKTHSVLISIEEGARGGFGAHILQFLAERGVLDEGLVFRPLCLPDRFIDHAAPFDMYEDAKLNAEHIAKIALGLM